ncbi:MAG: bifunctional diguanylate cyclase/phosphodiesterase [Clostridia bacterium]
MEKLDYFKRLFENHKYPCFVVDAKTKEVVYINYKLANILAEGYEIIGKKHVEILNASNISVLEADELNWNFEETLEIEVFDKNENKGYRAIYTRIANKTAVFCEMMPIALDGNVNYNFEETISRCMAVIKDETSDNHAYDLLEILGEFYEAKRTYFYKLDIRNNAMVPIEQWRCDGEAIEAPVLHTQMKPEKFLEWLALRNEVNIIDTSKTNVTYDENSVEAEVLDAFLLENVIVSVIENENKFPHGIIIVCDRENTRAPLRLLQVVSNFLEKEVTNTTNQANLRELMEKDVLTCFYNRNFYAKKIIDLEAELPKTLSVFFANVNGLRKVNGEYGYSHGDSLIKLTAESLLFHFENVGYRISGDEFIIFVENLEKSEFNKYVDALQKELKNADYPLYSIGYAFGEGNFSCSQLINEADTVMYINKQEYYKTSNRKYDEISDKTLSELLSYIENDEFMVYLQPQIRLSDNTLHGAEALVRRFDKTNQKMVFPDQFIAMYEKKSVIRHVDIFVIETVCKLLKEWIDKNVIIPISVNLSRVTLLEYGIVDTVANICDKYEVPHSLLVIEVTERVGIIENNVASDLINEFKDKGFSISLDDFGCAYSNIVTLAQIEVDEVKIDKSLVDNITSSVKNRILVKNMLTMCNELDDTATLAEGIEYENQVDLLTELNCHLGQGYFYSRPVTVTEFFDKYVQ